MTNRSFKTILKTTVGVPDGTARNTTQLVASINSLKARQSALKNIVSQVDTAPAQVQAKLKPILGRYVIPLKDYTSGVDRLLVTIASEISDFCELVAQRTQEAKSNASNDFLRKLDVEMLSKVLSEQAQTVHSVTASASSKLVDYRNKINTTAAQLNTYKQQLLAEIEKEKREIGSIKQKLYDMAHESFWKKILDGFKALFGNLQQELERDVAQMKMLDLEVHINKNMVNTIDEIVTDLSSISNVASALQISWRNLSDSIGNLQQDMDGITTNISASDWSSDLDYINSDWQNIKQILAKINS